MRAWTALVLAACHAPASVTPRAIVPAARVEVERAPLAEPEVKAATLDDGDLLSEDARPTLRATIEIDAETLPMASWGAPRKDSCLSFFTSSEGFRRFHVEGVSFAEVRTGDFLGFTGELDGFANDKWPECGPGKPSRAAMWRGISVVHWSDAQVTIVMSRGVLDGFSCKAMATSMLIGHAAAIVPRFVYALRFDRSVYVIMPGGPLAVASEDRAGHGPFSAIVLPLEPHHESAAAVRISNFGLARWRGMPELAVSLLHSETMDDPSASPLVVTEIRTRGDQLVLALSVSTVRESTIAADFVAAVEARAR